MSIYKNRILVICPAALKDFVNAQAQAGLDPLGADNTLSVALSPTGDGEPTHYWAHSMLTNTGLGKIALLATALPTCKAWVDGEGDLSIFDALDNVTTGDFSPKAVLASEGLNVISSQV